MRKFIAAAALSMAIAAPAFAQDTKPAVTPSVTTATKPAEPPKAQTTTSTQSTLPAAKPADPSTAIKKDEKKVDPKAAIPAGSTPKADAAKGNVATTTEKPAETKKQ